MPNTLAHLGVQTLWSKAILPRADFKWISLGCILPDLPWIVQRIVTLGLPGVNPVELRLYWIVQASLGFSLLGKENRQLYRGKARPGWCSSGRRRSYFPQGKISGAEPGGIERTPRSRSQPGFKYHFRALWDTVTVAGSLF